ncbi:MAG: ATP-binding protein [Alphaproteobacteria bacterium]|nr:ATP-binding protein [Alphaproteobacteria bacterium]
MERYLSQFILRDSPKKIILLSGPRQSGKTTLAKQLFKKFDYFNFDSSEDRASLLKKQWDRNADCILFDELHKMRDWKRWIKGIYDTEGNTPRLIVTGSANLDAFQKVGDSLAGRYFSYRLHPIDIKEGVTYWSPNVDEVFNRLMNYSGFPEPFLEGTVDFYRRWQKSHLDVILRQDFLDLYSVRSIKLLELLIDLLKPRVSSTTSYANLANDLQVDSKTIKSWIDMLENIYAIFTVTPYHTNIARSLLKEPKFYFYDIARVPANGSDNGARLENLVACCLLKEIHSVEDIYGHKGHLHYLRTKEGKEIDFLIVVDDKPILCIEVKSTDDKPAPSFDHFEKFLGAIPRIQLVAQLRREFTTETGIQVRHLGNFLAAFDLKAYLVS